MDDVEVQIVGAQALERAFDLALDSGGGEAAFVKVDLAGKDDIFASDAQIAQRGANVFLARAKTVAVSGVDKVHTGIDCTLDDGAGLVGPDSPLVEVGACLAKTHAAQAELGDLNVGMSKGGVLHSALHLL